MAQDGAVHTAIITVAHTQGAKKNRKEKSLYLILGLQDYFALSMKYISSAVYEFSQIVHIILTHEFWATLGIYCNTK